MYLKYVDVSNDTEKTVIAPPDGLCLLLNFRLNRVLLVSNAQNWLIYEAGKVYGWKSFLLQIIEL